MPADPLPDRYPRLHLPALTVAAGVLGGLVGAAYLEVLALVTRAIGPQRWGALSHAALLIGVGGTVVLLGRWLGAPGDVELLVDDIHVSGGADGLRRLRSLLPVSLLCIGVGGALGPEAPLVTTTGTLASWLGHRARRTESDRRVVTITGMAAGFTVLFGAPLGSAVFALEILHRRGLEYYEALLPAAGGSLCGYAVYVVVTGLGLEPLWQFPSPSHLHVADLGWAAAAGVVGAALAAAFALLATGLRAAARRLPAAAPPLLGALALAALGAASPYALTNGETQIADLTVAHVTVAVLLVAAVAKLVGSAVTLAAGWKGGFIIPLFFVGYCVGRAAGAHLPGAHEWVLATALMAAANVGVTKTPLGSTLVVSEMAGRVLLPTTLLASVVALLLSTRVGLIESQRRRVDAAGLPA